MDSQGGRVRKGSGCRAVMGGIRPAENEYRRSGIYPGKNLIFTYETDDSPLDIKGIKEMLKELLCEA